MHISSERDTIESNLFVKQFLVDRNQARRHALRTRQPRTAAETNARTAAVRPHAAPCMQAQLQKLISEREDIEAASAPSAARAAELTAAAALAQTQVACKQVCGTSTGSVTSPFYRL